MSITVSYSDQNDTHHRTGKFYMQIQHIWEALWIWCVDYNQLFFQTSKPPQWRCSQCLISCNCSVSAPNFHCISVRQNTLARRLTFRKKWFRRLNVFKIWCTLMYGKPESENNASTCSLTETYVVFIWGYRAFESRNFNFKKYFFWSTFRTLSSEKCRNVIMYQLVWFISRTIGAKNTWLS